MSRRVLDELIDGGRIRRTTAETLPELLTAGQGQLLLFTGDTAIRPEADDVAVVIRELLTANPGIWVAGVVERQHEATMAAQFRVNVFPSLVFLRPECAPRIVPRIAGWGTYRDAAQAVLALTPPTPEAVR